MTIRNLTSLKCKPCEGNVDKLSKKDINENLKDIKGWRIIKKNHLIKLFSFPDFNSALEFVNEIGELAENEGHHPDIALSWGKVEICLYTHAIKGLSMNDFILAAKIDLAL